MERIIIDASDLILGRLSTFAAKKSILGNRVDIVNCESCVIRGKKESIFARYKLIEDRGIPSKGPFLHKKPDRFVKRTIRGMIGYKKGRGIDAYKNIKCHLGVPDEFKDKELMKMDDINVYNQQSKRRVNHLKVGELCKLLGWKGL
tara:strand:- start:252 stop:689 length:438 start_codon:yes stop_codon:yes gene_type:complete